MKNVRRVVVVGTGVSGLACANRLLEISSGRGIDLKLVETASVPGGVLETFRGGGFLMEGGPDCFITEKTTGMALVKRLGLESQLIGTNPSLNQSFILHRGRLEPIPEGFYLLAPTRLTPLLTTRLLSPLGKLRAALEPFIPIRRDVSDESVGAFVRRRLGREVLDQLAQPLMGGVHNCDPNHLSLSASLPRFRELELKYGSLLRALAQQPLKGSSKASGARYSLFATFKDGIRTLADSLLSRLPEGCILTGCTWMGLVQRADALWEIQTSGGNLEADAVVLALQPTKMVSILGSVDPEWKELLGGIPAHDSATLNLGFRRDQVGHPLDGFGFVVPDNEGALMLGTTFSSLKFAGRAPEGHVLLRTFLGRKAAMALDIEGERETLRKVFAEVAKVLKVKGEPIVSKLARYRSSMSYYTPGHLSRADRIQRKSAETPGLFFAGNGLMGSGIPDCIASGEQAAESLLTHA